MSMRFTEKTLGASKFSNTIFERFRWVFDLVFSSNPVFINLLNYYMERLGSPINHPVLKLY